MAKSRGVVPVFGTHVNDFDWPEPGNEQDFFGLSVASIGDLNGDGVLDVLVGAAGDDDGGSDRGAVYVLFISFAGTASSTTTSTTTSVTMTIVTTTAAGATTIGTATIMMTTETAVVANALTPPTIASQMTTLKLSMTVPGVTLEALNDRPTMKTGRMTACKKVVVDSCDNFNATAENVAIVPRVGSVNVDSAVTVPAMVDATSLQSTLCTVARSGSVVSRMVIELNQVVFLSTIGTSGIGVFDATLPGIAMKSSGGDSGSDSGISAAEKPESLLEATTDDSGEALYISIIRYVQHNI